MKSLFRLAVIFMLIAVTGKLGDIRNLLHKATWPSVPTSQYQAIVHYAPDQILITDQYYSYEACEKICKALVEEGSCCAEEPIWYEIITDRKDDNSR